MVKSLEKTNQKKHAPVNRVRNELQSRKFCVVDSEFLKLKINENLKLENVLVFRALRSKLSPRKE